MPRSVDATQHKNHFCHASEDVHLVVSIFCCSASDKCLLRNAKSNDFLGFAELSGPWTVPDKAASLNVSIDMTFKDETPISFYLKGSFDLVDC